MQTGVSQEHYDGVVICMHRVEDERDKLKAVNADLLEACEAMLHRFGHLATDPGKREACEEARAAIAKEKGITL